MSDMNPTIVLTHDQIDFYHREGYLALKALTTQEEVTWLQAIYDRLFAERAGREAGHQFDLAGADTDDDAATLPQILGPSKYAPELLHGPFRANALAVARQLLGPEAQPQGEHAILKPARQGVQTPWHQDEAYWNPALSYNALSIWIPLQPATLANGCMQFVPGSHKHKVLPHHSINDDPRIHGLEVDTTSTNDAVACPLPPGGATVHTNRTLHYAGPNQTDEPRRAYILLFGVPPVPSSEPRDFYWNTIKATARQQRADQIRKQQP